MEWLPDINVKDADNEFLTDLELRKVKELHRSMRNCAEGPEKASLEIEIYKIYKAAMLRDQEENKKYEQEKLWNEMLQEAFNRQSKIMASLLLTLLTSGIVTLLFVMLGGLAPDETSTAALVYAVTIMAIISVVVAVVQYKKITKLKKEFDSGKLKHSV